MNATIYRTANAAREQRMARATPIGDETGLGALIVAVDEIARR